MKCRKMIDQVVVIVMSKRYVILRSSSLNSILQSTQHHGRSKPTELPPRFRQQQQMKQQQLQRSTHSIDDNRGSCRFCFFINNLSFLRLFRSTREFRSSKWTVCEIVLKSSLFIFYNFLEIVNEAEISNREKTMLHNRMSIVCCNVPIANNRQSIRRQKAAMLLYAANLDVRSFLIGPNDDDVFSPSKTYIIFS